MDKPWLIVLYSSNQCNFHHEIHLEIQNFVISPHKQAISLEHFLSIIVDFE